MNETLTLFFAWVAGFLLGAFFFGGLWWTVRRCVLSSRPARLVLVSLLLRMSIVLAGFYFIGHGNWQRIVVSLLGFIMARFILTRLLPTGRALLTRAPVKSENPQPKEVTHAP